VNDAAGGGEGTGVNVVFAGVLQSTWKRKTL
jgi:hypothetical protein